MRILLLALLAFVTGCSGCVSVPKGPDPHSFALRLEFESGVCSGTAVGPNELLTASHCFRGNIGKLVGVNGVRVDHYYGVSMKGDAIRVRVPGMNFRSFARVIGKARQGDSVFWHGNPLGVSDMLRRGYVASVKPLGILIVAEACTGDSGSGVFNERGELIGVVSKIAAEVERCSGMMLAVPA